MRFAPDRTRPRDDGSSANRLIWRIAVIAGLIGAVLGYLVVRWVRG